jgi:hypothetical protein
MRGLLGQQLLSNPAGYKVVRGSGKAGPWINQGESVSLIPIGVQEVSFQVELLGQDQIPCVGTVSVAYRFVDMAENQFNFGYNVEMSEHLVDFSDQVSATLQSVLTPALKSLVSDKEISASVKLVSFENESDIKSKLADFSIGFVSASFMITPNDRKVLDALGAEKSESLINSAAQARQTTKLEQVKRDAAIRQAEHGENMNAAGEAETLANERAKAKLAEANSVAAAAEVMDKQRAQTIQKQIEAFGGNSTAFALNEIAKSAGSVVITPELMAALRAGNVG